MRILLTAVVLFAHSAFAQSWTHLAPKGTHPAVTGASGVYDAASDRMIVFGGRDGKGDNRNDVWVLTNANGLGGQGQWINLIPNGAAGSPAPRSGQSAVYDAADNRLIIFGGCGGYCVPALNDVWVLTNANGLGGTPAWTQLPAGPLSPARTNAAMATIRQTISCSSSAARTAAPTLAPPFPTFGLSKAPTDLATSTPHGSKSDSGPSGQNGASAIFDPTTGVITVFGGTGLINGTCQATNAVVAADRCACPDLERGYSRGRQRLANSSVLCVGGLRCHRRTNAAIRRGGRLRKLLERRLESLQLHWIG